MGSQNYLLARVQTWALCSLSCQHSQRCVKHTYNPSFSVNIASINIRSNKCSTKIDDKKKVVHFLRFKNYTRYLELKFLHLFCYLTLILYISPDYLPEHTTREVCVVMTWSNSDQTSSTNKEKNKYIEEEVAFTKTPKNL